MRTTVRYAGMDGIKGLALIGVIWYHLSQRTLPGGFIGVEVFYTVSGFLLATSLLAEFRGRGYIRFSRFYLRRMLRLWPAVALMVPVVVCLGMVIDRDTLVGVAGRSVAALTFSTNWYEIAVGGSYFDSTSPQLLRHLWFVAVLAQITVLLPIMITLTERLVRERLRPLVPLALAVVSLVLMGVLYTPGADPTMVYFNTGTHCFGVLFGVFLAWMVSGRDAMPRFAITLASRMVPWLATASMLVMAVAATRFEQDAVAFRGGLAMIALLTLLLIAGTVPSASWMHGLLCWRPLALLGRYSYGLYLWHWPLYLLMQCLLPGWRGSGIWLIWTLTVVLSVVMTAISWTCVERPLIRWSQGTRGDSARGSVWWLRSIGTAVIIIALYVGLVQAIRIAPEKSSVQAMLEQNQSALDAASQQREEDAKAAEEARRRAEELAKAREEAKAQILQTLDGHEVTVIGDSVTVGSAPVLQQALPGVVVDAKTSRFIHEVPDVVSRLKSQGQLRRFVVVSANTNAIANPSSYERIAEAAGEGHVLIIVTGYGDRSWIPAANQGAFDYVRAHPGTANIADWNATIGAHTDMLTSDGIHPTPDGMNLYANLIKDTIAQWMAVEQTSS